METTSQWQSITLKESCSSRFPIVIIVHVNLTLFVSGRPNAPVISSEVESVYSDQFNLTWAVESHAEIRAYRIIYRKWMVRLKFSFLSKFFISPLLKSAFINIVNHEISSIYRYRHLRLL